MTALPTSNLALPPRCPAGATALPPAVLPFRLDGLADSVFGHGPGIAARVELGDVAHQRVTAAPEVGAGGFEFCALSDGFYIVAGELELAEAMTRQLSAPDMLRIRVASHGDGRYISSRGDRLSLESPTATLIIEPAGRPAGEGVFSGYQRYVHVAIHRNRLAALFSGSESELPSALRAFIGGRLREATTRSLSLGPALLDALEAVHGCALTGKGRRLFLQAKAIEILCHAVEALSQDADVDAAAGSPSRARGVLQAQQILDETFAAPPSLQQLATRVGLSRSGLCAGFRQVLGRSVYDYVQALRMQKALVLLKDRDASITQIAFDVGYSHVSSLSAAVQRRFGVTPTELRQRVGARTPEGRGPAAGSEDHHLSGQARRTA